MSVLWHFPPFSQYYYLSTNCSLLQYKATVAAGVQDIVTAQSTYTPTTGYLNPETGNLDNLSEIRIWGLFSCFLLKRWGWLQVLVSSDRLFNIFWSGCLCFKYVLTHGHLGIYVIVIRTSSFWIPVVSMLWWPNFWRFYCSEFDEIIFVGLVFEAVGHVGSPGGRGREERPGWIFYTLQSCHTMDTKPYHGYQTIPHEYHTTPNTILLTILHNVPIPTLPYLCPI